MAQSDGPGYADDLPSSERFSDSLERFINRKSLFIRDIDPALSKQEIKSELQAVCPESMGRICVPVDHLTAASLRCAYCNYMDKADAMAAFNTWRFRLRVRGKPVKMMFAVETKDRDRVFGPWGQKFMVMVKNLSSTADTEALCAKFDEFGEVFQANVYQDTYGHSYALVQFVEERSVEQAALRANNTTLPGHNTIITVEPHKSRYQGAVAPAAPPSIRSADDFPSLAGPHGGSGSGAVVPPPPPPPPPYAALQLQQQQQTYAASQEQQQQQARVQQQYSMAAAALARHELGQQQHEHPQHQNGFHHPKPTAVAAAGIGGGGGVSLGSAISSMQSPSSFSAQRGAPPAPSYRWGGDPRQPGAPLHMAASSTSSSARPASASSSGRSARSAAAVLFSGGAAAACAAGPLMARLGLRDSLRAAAKQLDHLAESLCCPITTELFRDPVVAADGHTYERGAIEGWLLTHGTSPMTNQPLPHKNVLPNNLIKTLICELISDEFAA